MVPLGMCLSGWPRRYGITQTLDQVFTAPNVVKRVLCDESRINEAYIGDRNTPVGVGGWVGGCGVVQWVGSEWAGACGGWAGGRAGGWSDIGGG